MKSTWTLRQLLAIFRGVAFIIAMFWASILFQLVPTLMRKGLAATREQIERIATAGVAPEHWNAAVIRMYEGLFATLAVGWMLFLAQRSLGRRLAAHRSRREVTEL
jgi:hypothetical protein